MKPGRSASMDELLANRRWVRTLAHRMATDPHTADDLAQETWLAALQKPPPDRRNPRGWLQRVLRRRAVDNTRSTLSRRRREARVARPDEAPADDVVERAELQTIVTRTVLTLEEPYRTTVLLRFFDEYSIDEIARLMNVPAATVRTRLRRAVEQLRARLDRRLGDRALLIAPLSFHDLGWLSPVARAAGWLQGVWMMTKANFAWAGLVAVLIGSGAVWWALEATNDARPGAYDGGVDGAPDVASLPAGLEGSSRAKAPGDAPSANATRVAGPVEPPPPIVGRRAVVQGRVLNERDRLVREGTVSLRTSETGWHLVPISSEGVFCFYPSSNGELRMPKRGEPYLSVCTPGYATHEFRVDGEDGGRLPGNWTTSTDLELRVTRRAPRVLHFEWDTGEPVDGVFVDYFGETRALPRTNRAGRVVLPSGAGSKIGLCWSENERKRPFWRTVAIEDRIRVPSDVTTRYDGQLVGPDGMPRGQVYVRAGHRGAWTDARGAFTLRGAGTDRPALVGMGPGWTEAPLHLDGRSMDGTDRWVMRELPEPNVRLRLPDLPETLSDLTFLGVMDGAPIELTRARPSVSLQLLRTVHMFDASGGARRTVPASHYLSGTWTTGAGRTHDIHWRFELPEGDGVHELVVPLRTVDGAAWDGVLLDLAIRYVDGTAPQSVQVEFAEREVLPGQPQVQLLQTDVDWRVYRSERTFLGKVRADEKGRFRLWMPKTEKTFCLWVSAPLMQGVFGLYELGAEQRRLDVTIQFDAFRHVVGRLYEPNGHAVPHPKLSAAYVPDDGSEVKPAWSVVSNADGAFLLPSAGKALRLFYVEERLDDGGVMTRYHRPLPVELPPTMSKRVVHHVVVPWLRRKD